MIDTFPVAEVVAVIIELELLLALYYGYRVIQNMKEDLDYSATRIFLSRDALRGIKVLLITLLSYSVLNLAAVLYFEGVLLDLVLRVIIFGLFAGFTYFMYQIARVTQK